MLFDTHAHLNFKAFEKDADEVLQDCLSQEIWVNNVGSQYDTSQRVLDIASKYPKGIFATVGLHPIHLTQQEVDEEEIHFKTREEKFDYSLYKTLAQNPKVVAIGECGLEYFRLPQGREEWAKKTQEEAFRGHIELAIETGKALMVHSRDAYPDISRILKEYRSRLNAVIIHSFIGSLEEARHFIEAGFYISFNGIITFKPRKVRQPGQSDPELLEVVKVVPKGQILLETDSPYLCPEPLRGQRNDPRNVKYVAEKLASIRGISFEDIVDVTAKNARKAFGI